MDRFAATTEHLRDSACGLLARDGARAFTQESLAEFAYVSIGAVYQRWRSKTATLTDVAQSRIVTGLTSAAEGVDFASHGDRCSFVFDSEDGRRLLTLASELILAARDHEDVKPAAFDIARAITDLVGCSHSDVSWWLTSAAVGWGMLRAGGLNLPPVGAELSAMFGVAGAECPTSRRNRGDVGPVTPPSPDPLETDEAGVRLKDATRRLLADPSRVGFKTRDVSKEADVPMGSMYRRFPSRAELLRALLIDEVQSGRYAWSTDMVAALTGPSPLAAAVDVLSHAVRQVYDDRESASLILEITVAARSEPVLRTQLLDQIVEVVDSRTALFGRLQSVGILADRPSADQVSWLFQAPPIGARALGALGYRPTDSDIGTGLERIIRALIAA